MAKSLQRDADKGVCVLPGLGVNPRSYGDWSHCGTLHMQNYRTDNGSNSHGCIWVSGNASLTRTRRRRR